MPTTRLVLGAHVLGPDAGEMAQLLGIALKAGLTKDDFDRTMAVHPTAAEELVTMYTPSYRVGGRASGSELSACALIPSRRQCAAPRLPRDSGLE